MHNEVLDDLTVVKRSGQRVPFNASKIAIAIKKAFDSVYTEPNEKQIFKVFEKVLTYINDNYGERKTINVEDIQDIIETKLQEEKFIDVYNSFNEYRNKRTASRKVFAEKQQHKFVKAIEKIQEENNLKTDSYLSPYNTLYKFGRIISSEYTKSYLLDSKFVRAAEEGYIYLHDVDYFSLGLLSNIHLKVQNKLLDDSCIDHFLTEIIKAQNEINGEIAIDSIDFLLETWTISKYKNLFKKYLTKYLNVGGLLEFVNIKKFEDIIDHEQGLEFNKDDYSPLLLNQKINDLLLLAQSDSLNEVKDLLKQVLHKLLSALESNAQRNTMFTISFGTNHSELGCLINQLLITECQIINLNKVNLIFKINDQTQENLMSQAEDLLLNKKVLHLAFVSSSYNKDNNDVEYFSNGMRIFDNINSGEKLSTGRMVVSTTSINLARIGLKYQNKNKNNYEVLFDGNVYDDEKLEGNQHIRKVIKNGTLNIGIIGLKECVMSLEHDENKQYSLIINLLKNLNEKCAKFIEETKLNFGIYEITDFKSRKELIAIDKSIYGLIDNVTNKNYYELIDSLKVIKDDYAKLGNIQKMFKNGELLTINMPNNISMKKINELIKELKASDIGFVRIKVGKDEN